MTNKANQNQTRLRIFDCKFQASLLALLLAALPMISAAQSWDSLTSQQREVLAPFSAEWPNFDQAQREHLLASAELWAGMSPNERSRLAENLRAWQSLDAETQTRLRELRQYQQRRLREFQSLPLAEQRRLLRRDWLRNLPAPQRQKLIRGSRALSPAERQQLREQLNNLPFDERLAWLDELLSSSDEAEFRQIALRGPTP